MGQCVSTAHLAALDDQIADHEQAITNFRKELETKSKQLDFSEHETKNATEEIDELRLQIRDLRVQRDVKEKQRYELELALDRRTQEAEGQRRVLEAAKQEAMRDAQRTKKELEKAHEGFKKVEAEMMAVVIKCEEVKTEMVALKTQLASSEERASRLEADKDQLSVELEGAAAAGEAAAEKKAADHADWQQRLDMVQSEHATLLEQQTASHAQALATWVAEKAGLQAQHTSSLEEFANDRTKGESDLRAELVQTKLALAAAQQQHAAVAQELQRLRQRSQQEIMDVRGSVTKSSSRYERLQAEHEILKHNSEYMLNASQKELAETQERVKAMVDEIEKLRQSQNSSPMLLPLSAAEKLRPSAKVIEIAERHSSDEERKKAHDSPMHPSPTLAAMTC